jgi:hypothetical protein
MCSGALFVQSVLVPPEHEKECNNVYTPECTGMHYVAHISHKIEKHVFGITCPRVIFMESLQVPPEQKNTVSTWHAPDAAECTM